MQIKLQVVKVNSPVGSQQRKCFIVPLPKAAFLCRSRIKARQMRKHFENVINSVLTCFLH